ncbi:hypothetical protein CC1G_03244 [Coprinopsis cinerea okayama7|uniref:Uncharacterized protein n=1 Tax=Coprinopsis cinerea (strain Okayama-7 / 130 / ATCC MYA-4618 / FGSC 9003) TaxID=240176 RepID=A8N7A1_COPC7|nr:hypothetical protein CC1G_03244 [Coprinopsis cinerea okayama7\|eukprot:XP_001830707.2 hypothetical protein CC1G_03244 [Coprinopsis cinerea okayama7\
MSGGLQGECNDFKVSEDWFGRTENPSAPGCVNVLIHPGIRSLGKQHVKLPRDFEATRSHLKQMSEFDPN